MAFIPEEVVVHAGERKVGGIANPSYAVRQSLRGVWTTSFVLLCSLAAGCVTTGPLLSSRDAGPTGTVCQVVACWDNHVAYAPDPIHNGRPTPGIAGRLYLFGQEIGTPLVGEGPVVVDLYDDTHPAAGPNPPPLEEWRIDKDTLKRLQRRDYVGAGYTLFLPWGTYRPDITKVRLQLSFQPLKGTPLYAPTSAITLSDDAGTADTALTKYPTGPSGRIVSK